MFLFFSSSKHAVRLCFTEAWLGNLYRMLDIPDFLLSAPLSLSSLRLAKVLYKLVQHCFETAYN